MTVFTYTDPDEPDRPYTTRGDQDVVRAYLKASRPHYTSTYCIHDDHQDCRLVCKTCQSPCRCPCHTQGTRTTDV